MAKTTTAQRPASTKSQGTRKREKKSAPPVGRDARGKFLAGVSGNPAGSKITVPEEVRELARKYSAEGILTLVKWMRSGDSNASLAATKLLLDRGLGKSIQPLVGSGNMPSINLNFGTTPISTPEEAQRVYELFSKDSTIDVSQLTFAPTPKQEETES